MSDILSKIIEEQVDFEINTGRKPRNVYLGREDIRELKVWFDENNLYSLGANEPATARTKCSGLWCYEVDEDRHIACS